MRILLISGKAGSGKDTVAGLLREINPAFKIDYFARALKDTCQRLTGLPEEYWYDPQLKERFCAAIDTTPRDYMQRMGDAMRLFDELIFVKATMNNLKPDTSYILPDLRYKNELIDNTIKIRVNRPGIKQHTHKTETDLDDFKGFHYTIENDGDVMALRDKVATVYRSICFSDEFARPVKFATK